MTLALVFLAGLAAGVSVAPLVAWWGRRQARPAARFVITSRGVVVWSGNDGLTAKQWWEDATAHPGPRDLQFLMDGALRDRFTVSA